MPPGLNFFELRNRAVEWAGGDKPKEGGSASSQEMTMAKDSLVEAIERQNKLMERRMDALESALKQQNPSGGGRFRGIAQGRAYAGSASLQIISSGTAQRRRRCLLQTLQVKLLFRYVCRNEPIDRPTSQG